jgi:uncharacterized protein (TIGR03435 family)
MSFRLLTVTVAALVAAAGLSSQAPAPQQSPSFEIASIKPANPATLYASSGSESTLWRATNFSLFMLVQRAYPDYGDPDRIIGGPSWVHEAKFDIQAKAAEPPSPATLDAMLRNLLAQRLNLRTHVERRELDVYVARLAQGRPGPWLMRTAPECVTARQQQQPAPDSCRRIEKAREAAGGGRALTLLALTMPTLFGVLREVGGFEDPIVDRTGLDGLYDVSVQYQSANPLNVPTGGTSLVAAAEDQLGLKFERGRELLDVLVIDSASMPTPD